MLTVETLESLHLQDTNYPEQPKLRWSTLCPHTSVPLLFNPSRHHKDLENSSNTALRTTLDILNVHTSVLHRSHHKKETKKKSTLLHHSSVSRLSEQHYSCFNCVSTSVLVLSGKHLMLWYN